MNLNIVQIIGRITNDLKMKSTTNQIQVLNFGVATNRNYKDKNGEKQTEVQFHNILAFGRFAETISAYFKKGDEIYIQGRLKTSTWDSDGVKKYRTDILLEKFEFGQKNKNNNVSEKSESKEEISRDYIPDEINVEDIPF